jgi:hypothetical protein
MMNIKDKYSDVATYHTDHGTAHRTLEKASELNKLHKYLHEHETPHWGDGKGNPKGDVR